MEQSIYNFFLDYLKDLHIQVKERARAPFPLSDLDLGLRNSILKLPAEPAASSFSAVEAGRLYHVEDYYLCHYTFFLLPEETSFLFLGPYLTENLDEPGIRCLMKELSIPPEQFSQLRNYYQALPLILDRSFFSTFLQRAYCEMFQVEAVQSIPVNLRALESQQEFLENHEFIVSKDPVLSMHLLEERYQLEDAVLDAVSQGNAAKAMAYAEQMANIRFSPRTDNPLRNQKNMYIVLNTLLRRTAYLAGVHPVYIDEVSENYARMIEQCTQPKELLEFTPLMIQKYCSLVEKQSLSSYSKPIQQILVTIDTSPAGDLSLKRFANDLFLNTSYLSALFKKEVGVTLTDYVNKSRIVYAQKLLRSTALSVQDIAVKCGIPDAHYFTRLFRRETGMSPREYRN